MTWVVVAGLLVAAFVGLAAALDLAGGRAPEGDAELWIVAGCRVMPDGAPSDALARRVAIAVDAHRRGVAPRLLFTGGVGSDAPIAEARCAADLAHAAGVATDVVWVEDQSRDTLQNAAFAARVVAAATGRPAAEVRIVVVSDRAHVFRCRRMFGRHFRVIGGAGATPPFGPRVRQALREAAGVLHHGLRGRL